MSVDYWKTQQPDSPLFPDVEWNKPEQRARAGKLGVVGGNTLGFASVAECYGEAIATGAGALKVLLPDTLKKTIPSVITDTVFSESTKTGGLAKSAKNDLLALSQWSDSLLFIGDAGRNSETAIVYEAIISETTKPITITRDAIDLIKNSYLNIVDRPDTMLVLSFAQLQNLMRSVYFPKMITFSMQLNNLVETLHKFTITYPITIVTLHQNHILIAHGGQVVTQPWDNPMRIWRGNVATRAACYWLWNSGKPLEAIAASITNH